MRGGFSELRFHSALAIPTRTLGFPKGHVEEGDADRRATAARELKEETGISDAVFVDDFQYRTAYNFRHKGKESTRRYSGISQKLKQCL